jgi:hypothetical protein
MKGRSKPKPWRSVAVDKSGGGTEIHTVPVEDAHPHTYSARCPCEPAVLRDVGSCLVTHNSWDGRESAEDRPRLRN